MKTWRKVLGTVLSVGFALFCAHNSLALDNSDIVISAVSAGGASNSGELIELQKLSDDSISLTGLSIRYQNSSGSVDKPIYEFMGDVKMTGESLLLRLASSEGSEMSDLTYTSPNLAQGGGKISLLFNESEIDSVCWGNFPDCEYPKFTSANPTTLVRNLVTNQFAHLPDYEPDWQPGREVLITTTPSGEPEEVPEPHCRGIQFSEILTYYESSKTEQFIELYNTSATQINLDGCVVKYKNKTYPLEGIVLPEHYFVRYLTDFTLTKNPTTSNTIEIIDVNGEVTDSLTYYNGQRKAMAFAQFGYGKDGSENWLQTYAPTPGEENNFQKYKTCPEGKVINEETGNCVKETSVSTALEPCPAGSYRNPLTNRCKKYATTASAELKPCAEGYERNPETNRCRKVVSNEGAAYPLAAETFEEKSSFIAIWAIVAVGVLGAGYVIFEYRTELLNLFKKTKQK